MKYFTTIALFALAISPMACGVSDDAKLNELEDADAEDICSEVTAESKDCGNGLTVSREAGAECTASIKALPASCSATVGDFRECSAAPVCDILSNSACANIAKCALSGS